MKEINMSTGHDAVPDNVYADPSNSRMAAAAAMPIFERGRSEESGMKELVGIFTTNVFGFLAAIGLTLMGLGCAGDGYGPASQDVPPSASEKASREPTHATGSAPVATFVQGSGQNITPALESNSGAASIQDSPHAPVQMAFFDSRIFDDELSSSMSGGASKITVSAPSGFTLNKIPERFDRWLYSVKEGGGKVVAKPEHQLQMRGIVSAVIDVIVSIFEKIDEMALYRPSQQYNATLLYREDGSVKEVVFERREGNS